jgi:hypothetical protein
VGARAPIRCVWCPPPPEGPGTQPRARQPGLFGKSRHNPVSLSINGVGLSQLMQWRRVTGCFIPQRVQSRISIPLGVVSIIWPSGLGDWGLCPADRYNYTQRNRMDQWQAQNNVLRLVPPP